MITAALYKTQVYKWSLIQHTHSEKALGIQWNNEWGLSVYNTGVVNMLNVATRLCTYFVRK